MLEQNGAKPTVHVLGGGPSGLSAAFHLTSPKANPDWQSRYDVVVHQLGWRLGGKGATGRSPDRAWRVEEHGIHLFGNMYSNSLHQMHEALTELDNGLTMETEFLPSDFQLVTDFYGGRWHGFDGGLPHNDEKPWLVDSAVASPEALVQSIAGTIKGILEGQELPVPGEMAGPRGLVGGFMHWLGQNGEQALISTATTLLNDLHLIHTQDDGSVDLDGLLHLMERAVALVDAAMGAISGGSDKLRWVFVQVDLLATAIRGTLADDIVAKGIDSIDHVPYREWLTSHGADELTMQSSLLQAIPNTCMQYPNGDSTTLPQMAASAYLTFILRQVVAPGDAAYFFKVGTGETVILPIYDVLIARGVRFEFFHKITDLVPDATKSRIETIKLDVQATTISGDAYDPIVTIPETGERVWPSEPRYELLVQGDQMKDVNVESWWSGWTCSPEEISLGPDDHLIVALPPKAQHYSCQSALLGDADWRTMIDHVETTPTQALQIWLSKPLSELGWRDLDGTNRWLGPAYTNPISAFGDFTESIKHEVWPVGNEPQGLIYFCGVLQDPTEIPDFDDHEFPAQQKQRVRDMAAQYLRQLGGLLPGAGNGQLDANSLDFSLLTCYDETTPVVGENRVDQQYYRANIDPNERYTVSAPGTLKYRLKAWGSSYSNVTLSSDAIYTGFNIGSFEGSVMSGKLASHAVTGAPALDQIYGYDFMHPDVEAAPAPPLPSSTNEV